MIHNQINTRYHHRKNSLAELILAIHAFTLGKVGNYIVFFPSYAYLQLAYDAYCEQYKDEIIHKQASNMNENEKANFLKLFDNTNSQQLFFCVLGGMFSEGIDYKYDKLLGAIVVSVALPQVNPHLELCKEYFDEHDLDGYAYSYRYPAMNKVLQAIGRVIRSKDDYGALLLIDDRYQQNHYLSLFPKHLSHYEFVSNANQILQHVTHFFASKK